MSVVYDPVTDVFEAQFDRAAIDPSEAVIEAIADVRDVEPIRLDPLYEFVDPEALDRICADRSDADCTVTFAYLEYRVAITDSGVITIRPRRDE
ncbi:HalOD1 output domain-containing protein [Halosolutus gelatinilyticus]|uniref:HalOD1 output domain-containing protein n=1 Tax=Halosolutus gelatinilyticus TaxID=2931975 RepID=UPI001FF5A393|nr:HalOD1 output domain-containing protein [Halosolutus gelatinilyticus]